MYKVCVRVCVDCPFSNTSTKSWLADYTVEDFVQFQRLDVLFPCHRLVSKDMAIDDAQEMVRKGKMMLCRGYVESMVKSAKRPRDPQFMAVLDSIRYDLSEKSLNIFEFVKHHTRSTGGEE